MAQGDGKREYVRVNDQFNVRLVKSGAGSKGKPLVIDTSKSVNVSGSGMLISMDTKLEVGDTVKVTFMKPNTFDFFTGSGAVIHVQKDNDGSYRVGIQFAELAPKDRDALDYYITLGKTQ